MDSMILDSEACYRALKAKDSRFDGIFFVGVSSTGVYCRCVCSARLPKRENCTFFACAAAAEKAGFRPCLLCRPETAPGRSRLEATGKLAHQAVRRIEDGALCEMGVDGLAEELGVTDRHLRRAVAQHYGVTPVELAQTQRLLTAKRLLTDTAMSIGEVAFASGFDSLRRFNAAFQERYRLRPTDIRHSAHPAADGLRFEIAYRAPYDWEGILNFLGTRAIPGVETSTAISYIRTVRVGDRAGWVSASRSSKRDALIVDMPPQLASVAPQVLRRVKRLFDIAAEPTIIAECLGELAIGNEGLRVPGAFDGFEAAVRAILGQQVSVAAARTFAGRLAVAFGEEIDCPIEGLSRTFPSPVSLAGRKVDEISSIGLVKARAKTIIALAQELTDKGLKLVPGVDIEQTLARLKTVPGIGDWTAQYIAMRALAYPDAFPASDLGVLKALKTKSPAEAQAIAEAWRPWRAYATMHLWRTLQ